MLEHMFYMWNILDLILVIVKMNELYGGHISSLREGSPPFKGLANDNFLFEDFRHVKGSPVHI